MATRIATKDPGRPSIYQCYYCLLQDKYHIVKYEVSLRRHVAAKHKRTLDQHEEMVKTTSPPLFQNDVHYDCFTIRRLSALSDEKMKYCLNQGTMISLYQMEEASWVTNYDEYAENKK